MSFKDISYLELWQSLCSMEWNHLYNFGRVHHEEQFCEIIFIWTVVQEAMPFKDITYLELWKPLCPVDRNHLCNFDRRHHEEQFCEIILNLDQWCRRKCCSRYFLSGALAPLLFIGGEPFVQFRKRVL